MRTRALLLSFTVLAAACGPSTPPVAPLAPQPGDPPVADAPPADEPPVSPNVARGVHALESNDLAGAKAAFQAALSQNPQDADALYYLGALAEKTGDARGAEAEYKAAIAARPGYARAVGNLSGLYDDAGRFDDALAIVTPAIAQHARDATLHMNAGIAYAGKKDQASAVRELDAAVAIAPQDPSFKLVYAHWLAVLGRKEDALAKLRQALPLASKDVGLVAAIGHEQHLLQAFPDCIATLNLAIALKDAAELWTEKAACKIGSGDDAGATADLKTATGKDASYAPAQYYLGNQLVKAGDFAGAVAAYQAFLKLEPSGPLAKSVQAKLKDAKAHAH